MCQRNRRNCFRFMNNARWFFAAPGTNRIERVITDSGSCSRAVDFTDSLREIRHCRLKPYKPRCNGKVERHNRIHADELLYSRECIGELSGALPSRSAMSTTISPTAFQRAEDDRLPLALPLAAGTTYQRPCLIQLICGEIFQERVFTRR